MLEDGNLVWVSDMIKILGPLLVISAIIYFLVTSYYKQSTLSQNMEYKKSTLGEARHLKIQAYERLMLMIERIEPSNLFIRLNTFSSTVGQMSQSIMIASQQEYDHNISQQLYVSNELWSLIEKAKDMAVEMVVKASDGLDKDQPSEELLNRFNTLKNQGFDPFGQVKEAIKEEFNVIL